MSEHTQFVINTQIHGRINEDDERGAVICEIPYGENGKPDEVNDKYARLIAAAPELLKVVKAMDDYWSEDYDGPDDKNAKEQFHSQTIDIWNSMRAAIVKAEESC